MLGILLLFITMCHGGGTHSAFMVLTDVQCETTRDCHTYYNDAWCHRGLVCLQTRCWSVPDFPCPRTEWCDERDKRCVKRNCTSWRDCDDGIFCNGEELCVDGQCVADPDFDCTQSGYMCNEAEKRCSQPLSVAGERDRIRHSGQMHTLSHDTYTIANASNSSNTTIPVGDVSTSTLIWVVVAVAALLFVIMIFWLIQQAAGRRPQAIMVDRDAVNGDRIFVPETYY